MGSEAIQMARWEGFRPCPGCGFDIATGEGERSCSWGDCPYLPEELNVFCETCRFNFFTMEGNPPCEEPLDCAHAAGTTLAFQANKREATGSSARGFLREGAVGGPPDLP
jgi:hypothetical protein